MWCISVVSFLFAEQRAIGRLGHVSFIRSSVSNVGSGIGVVSSLGLLEAKLL